MPEIRLQSPEDGRCSVYFGDSVVICDLTRADAEAVVRSYDRMIRIKPNGVNASKCVDWHEEITTEARPLVQPVHKILRIF